jgi:hypothetical protein
MKPDAWIRRWFVDGEKPKKVMGMWPLKFRFVPMTVHKCLPDDEPAYSAATIRKWLEEEPSEAVLDAGYSVGSECPICIRPNYSIEGAFKAMIAAKLQSLEGGK